MSRITRRQFSAGLLASSALAWQVRAAKAAANDRIPMAVIGARYRGWQLAYGFDLSGQFDVQTLCDCDSACYDEGMKFIRERGTMKNTPRHEKDFRKVLDDPKIQAVALAVPDHWHAAMALRALKAGKHVYIEKPLAYCVAEGRAILDAEKAHPKQVVAVGTQQRSGRHFRDAAAFIAQGGVGKVAFARAWMSAPRGVVAKVPDADPPKTLDYDLWRGPAPMRPYNVSRVHYNWHFMHDTGTGDMGNWGAHFLDTVRQLTGVGAPRGASSMGGQFVVHDAKEFPDTQTVLYDFPGMTVVWEQRHWTKFKVNDRALGAEISGDEGAVVIDRDGWVFQSNEKDARPVSHPTSAMEEPHLLNFAECIRGQARPAAPAIEAHHTAIMIHLGNISQRVGRSIRFDAEKETIPGDAEAARLLSREYRSEWPLNGT